MAHSSCQTIEGPSLSDIPFFVHKFFYEQAICIGKRNLNDANLRFLKNAETEITLQAANKKGLHTILYLLHLAQYQEEEYMIELTKTYMRYYMCPNFWLNTPDILPPELTQSRDYVHLIRLVPETASV